MIAADVEELVVTYLSQTFPYVGVMMPPALPGQDTPPFPFYLVQRLTGGDDMITDRSIVQIDCFDISKTRASVAARAMHLLMNPFVLTPKLQFTLSMGKANVDRVATVESPTRRDYDNPNYQRYVARYEIDLRANLTT